MYKQQQKLQGHNLVFISFQAVSYPLLEFLGHCRVSRKKEIEQINNLHIFFLVISKAITINSVGKKLN